MISTLESEIGFGEILLGVISFFNGFNDDMFLNFVKLTSLIEINMAQHNLKNNKNKSFHRHSNFSEIADGFNN